MAADPTSDGMIQTGPGTYVNSKYINDAGRAQAATFNPVASSSLAANDFNNINTDVNQTSNAIDVQVAKRAADTKAAADLAAKKTPPAPETPQTPEQQMMNTPGEGNMFIYDKATGARNEVPIGSQVQGTMTTSDPNKPSDAGSVSAGSTTYKQLSDGSWGAYDDNGKYLGAANQGVVAAAKGAQQATKDLESIRNGTFPLNPLQQAQLDQVTQYYQKLIDAQNTENANVTGNETGIQNLYGVGGTSIAVSAINKTIQDGSQKIAQLNNEMMAKISSLKASIQADDVSLVKSQYDEYKQIVDDKQKELDRIHTETVNAAKAIDAKNMQLNVANAKKYPEAGILPTDTPDIAMAKLQATPQYQQDTATKAVLTDEENAYFADMLTSGFSMSKILPNLGYGTAGTQAKIAVLKPMIEKAKAAGLSGAEFGASMIDKTSKADAFKKLEQRKTLIASNEDAVVNDFDKVLLPAAKKLSAEQWRTASPLLNEWLQTSILPTTGDPALNNYLGSLTTTLTKYSNVVAGNTGAGGVTQSMNDEVQNLLRRGLSYEALKSYVDTVAKPEMHNTVQGFDNTQQDIKDGLNHLDGTFSENPSAGNGGSVPTTSGVKTNADGTLQSVSF